jgi:hypothetical protein
MAAAPQDFQQLSLKTIGNQVEYERKEHSVGLIELLAAVSIGSDEELYSYQKEHYDYLLRQERIRSIKHIGKRCVITLVDGKRIQCTQKQYHCLEYLFTADEKTKLQQILNKGQRVSPAYPPYFNLTTLWAYPAYSNCLAKTATLSAINP